MNTQLFEQAQTLYSGNDYRGALRVYTSCLQDTTVPFARGEVGLIYHRIGNCLVKLKNPTEAIQAYAQATADPTYDAKGALQNNIGMAYATLKDYENAVKHFELAVQDVNYKTPYKAYMGLGNAQLKLGKSAEAGVAFREAALDEENPDPAKALLNLGICFMALDRPEDAIASYDSALQFEMSQDTLNRLNASMGQAYAANGQMVEAVNAFEAATMGGNYFLSDSASVDYQRALSAVAKDAAQIPMADTDLSGLDVTGNISGIPEEDPFFYDTGYDEAAVAQYPGFVDAYNGNDDRFFESSPEEIEQWSKSLAKKDRKRRNVGLKILVFLIIILIIALAGLVFAYTQGYGFPTQTQITQELFAAPESAGDNVFSSSVTEENRKAMLAPVVPDSDVKIDGVSQAMTDSVVYATADTQQGGTMTYKLVLVRDMIGWKVSSIELYFPSQNQ